jgi:hypothetical protein
VNYEERFRFQITKPGRRFRFAFMFRPREDEDGYEVYTAGVLTNPSIVGRVFMLLTPWRRFVWRARRDRCSG